MNALRGRPLLVLSVCVLVAHLWLGGEVLPERLGEGAADTPRRRIEVAFVRELAPVAVVPAPAPREPPRRAALPVARPASAPVAPAPVELQPPPPSAPAQEVVEVAEPVQEPLPALPDMQTLAAAAAAAAAAQVAASAAASASASAPTAFEWPPSTRLSYHLTGHYRGPVEGQARVEWLRSGTRYQVFLEASVGPSFAPLMTRRESSEGEITANGLSPRRYDMKMKVALRDPRLTTIFMDPERVRLPGGQDLPRPPGLQDAVSQFVHLTWLFTTQPHWLTPGRVIEMPLALPRRVEVWTYDVLGGESLHTSAGLVETVHVKPRREARAGDYTAEIWVAPSLQYLPVRILVRQDAETFIDMQIERLPEQAERGR